MIYVWFRITGGKEDVIVCVSSGHVLRLIKELIRKFVSVKIWITKSRKQIVNPKTRYYLEANKGEIITKNFNKTAIVYKEMLELREKEW